MKLELPFNFDMAKSAFVVVDMQNDFVRSNAPLGVPDAIGTVDAIRRIKKLFGPTVGRHYSLVSSREVRKARCGLGPRRFTSR